uniref:Phospholipase A2-like central domain-containing protein n=1 Tax=Gadus morhua TaxID=8049 RepID=A0A8C5BGU4_GADMO
LHVVHLAPHNLFPLTSLLASPTFRCCWDLCCCYSNSMQPDECWPIFDNPYTEHYFYDCKNHEVTCSGQNNKCERFICECDRKVECFARSKLIKGFLTLSFCQLQCRG